MIQWDLNFIGDQMRRLGATAPNANQLRRLTGLNIATAYSVFSGAPLQRVDTTTLQTLMRAFGIDDEGLLLDYTPDP